MVDTRNIDLLSLVQRDGAQLVCKARTDGGEYAGPCPFCGGVDRFHVWPHCERPRFWCRACDARGDVIDYARQRHGLDFAGAVEWLGLEVDRKASTVRTLRAPDRAAEPAADWRSAAWNFIDSCMPAGATSYVLGRRGFSLDTIVSAQIRYNPRDRHLSRIDFGLPGEIREDGRERMIWAPRGIVIPIVAAGKLWGVAIRRLDDDLTEQFNQRYVYLTGSKPAPYNIDGVATDKPVMLVEGILDALAVWQTARELVTPVAVGTTGGHNMRWYMALSVAPSILLAHDDDDAGHKAAARWRSVYPSALRWCPIGDDPAAMLEDGADVARWVASGLKHAVRVQGGGNLSHVKTYHPLP